MKKQILFSLLSICLLAQIIINSACQNRGGAGQKAPVVKQEYLDGAVMIRKGQETPLVDLGSYLGARTLRQGMKGDDVASLQDRLKLAGFVNYKFSPGVFDDLTKKAVQEYQQGGSTYLKEFLKVKRESGVPATGIADLTFCRQLIRETGYYSKLIPVEVSSGESLSSLSNRFHVPVKELVSFNNLEERRHFIRAGQIIYFVLRPDPQKETNYRVLPKEDLEQIAAKFQLPLTDIIKANCLFKVSVQADDSLYIPANPEASD